jgi:hypothetical protein
MLFIVDAPRTDASIEWFLKYKEHLKQKFNQPNFSFLLEKEKKSLIKRKEKF